MSGNEEAKAAAKKRKEERRKGKLRIGGREISKRRKTHRKHVQGKNSTAANTKDPRVK